MGIRQRVRKVLLLFFLNPAPMMTSVSVSMTKAYNLFLVSYKATAWLPDPQALTFVSYKVPK